MLFLVDAYWYQYPPLNPLWHGILGFMIGVLGFVSVIGNGMVSGSYVLNTILEMVNF